MAITRHEHDKNSNKDFQASETLTQWLKNPTHEENWPTNPTTPLEFQEWMEQNTSILKTWLKEARARAEDEGTQKRIKKFGEIAEEEWQRYEPETDVQTGTIWDDDARKECEDLMRNRAKERIDMHAKENTASRNKDYCLAQAAWEDFLYYQNVWNRRDHRQRILKYRIETKEKKKEEEEQKRPEDDKLDYVYDFWRVNIMEQFRKFELGYRKKAPDTVPMSEAHRYSQPPRGTKSKASSDHENRYKHIQERFPSHKRQAPTVEEREEGFHFEQKTQTKHLLGGKEGGRGDESVPIKWSVDDGSAQEIMRAKEVNRSDGPNKRRYIHHACLEQRSNIRTSLESSTWGNTISRTAMRAARVGDKIMISAGQTDPDGVVHTEDTEYEAKAGEHLGKYASKPRFKKKLEQVSVQVLELERTRTGRLKLDKNKDIIVDWVEGMTEQLVFATKPGGNERIVKEPKKGRRMFYQTIVGEGPPYATRQSRLVAKNALNELSDVSERDSSDSDVGEDTNKGGNDGKSDESESSGIPEEEDRYGGDKFWQAYEED